MTNPASEISLGKFALIAGISMVLIGTAPYAEFFVYNKLVVSGNAAETVKNILPWTVFTIKPVLFPHVNLDFIGITFLGNWYY